jgi:uncharacterized membrane protein
LLQHVRHANLAQAMLVHHVEHARHLSHKLVAPAHGKNGRWAGGVRRCIAILRFKLWQLEVLLTVAD